MRKKRIRELTDAELRQEIIDQMVESMLMEDPSQRDLERWELDGLKLQAELRRRRARAPRRD